MAKAKQVNWRATELAPIVLVFGPESYLALRAIRQLRERMRAADPALEVHEVSAADYVTNQLSSLASPSLFGEPRLIVVDAVERCSDALIEDALEYLSAISSAEVSDVVLVLRHNGSSVRGKKLLDAIRESPNCLEVLCNEIKRDSDKASFVESEFSAAHRKITPGAVRALTAAFNDDLAELSASCLQLIQDTENLITEEVVDQYYGGRVETNAFKVADAALAGRTGEALVLLRHALATGSDPIPIVAAISMKIRQLAKIYSNRNASAASLQMQPWQLDRAKKDLVGWNEDGLAATVIALADADAGVKGAERDPIYVLESLITRIAAKGR